MFVCKRSILVKLLVNKCEIINFVIVSIINFWPNIVHLFMTYVRT